MWVELCVRLHKPLTCRSAILKRLSKKQIANDDIGTDLKSKSKTTQALYLFESGKKPIDIAIELDISYSEVIDLQQEYWALRAL